MPWAPISSPKAQFFFFARINFDPLRIASAATGASLPSASRRRGGGSRRSFQLLGAGWFQLRTGARACRQRRGRGIERFGGFGDMDAAQCLKEASAEPFPACAAAGERSAGDGRSIKRVTPLFG